MGFVLILGGARSGKSQLAGRLAREFEGPVTFVATATPDDAEMDERSAATAASGLRDGPPSRSRWPSPMPSERLRRAIS